MTDKVKCYNCNYLVRMNTVTYPEIDLNGPKNQTKKETRLSGCSYNAFLDIAFMSVIKDVWNLRGENCKY